MSFLEAFMQSACFLQSNRFGSCRNCNSSLPVSRARLDYVNRYYSERGNGWHSCHETDFLSSWLLCDRQYIVLKRLRSDYRREVL